MGWCPVTAPEGGGARRQGTDQAFAALLDEHSRLIAELASDQAATQTQREEDQARIEELRRLVESLLAQEERERGYVPAPAPRWWQLDGAAREEAIGYLRKWVEHVYKPCYEHIAEDLGECWDKHPLCLFILDWLSEMHNYLYLRDKRSAGNLGGMADWHTRFLPIAAEIMAVATKNCEHRARQAVAADARLAGHLGAGNGNAGGRR